MARFKQFHDPELSIWQAAVGEIEAKSAVGAQTLDVGAPIVVSGRPDDLDDMSSEAIAYCKHVDEGIPITATATAQPSTEGLLQTLGFCSLAALKLAKAKIVGDPEGPHQVGLAGFGDCDPRYAEAAAKYAEYFIAQQKQIPYLVYTKLSDYVIDGKLPSTAKVAILGDWGTGQDAAKLVLRQIANKNPDVVIHLGDIYFAGTQFEVNNYFLPIWKQILNLGDSLNRIPTFTLAGNHDMYSGGGPYYDLIKKLGQPASYFCLRNDNWQFIAMDTGYHDHNPAAGGDGATFLQDTEVTWLTDKINNAGSRKNVLLSHHQLFTAFDAIDNGEINMRLYPQVAPILPKVAMWIWGHEHDFTLYDAYKNLARSCCLGHAAFPVGQAEVPEQPKHPQVPLIKGADGKPVRLGLTGGLYNHGYAIIYIDGAAGQISYYQDSDEDTPMFKQALT